MEKRIRKYSADRYRAGVRFLESLFLFFNKHIDWVYAIVGASLLIFLAITISLDAIHKASYFNGYPTNGAFQLLNPLRRFLDGQVVGQDFFLFHGVGAVLIHFPIFFFFGQDIFASEFAHSLVSPMTFFLVVWTYAYALSRKWTRALFWASAALLVGWTAQSVLVIPGNSILSVRSFFPPIALSVLYLFRQYPIGKNPFVFGAIGGLLSMIAFFISTEHGLAMTLAFGVATAIGFPGGIITRSKAMGTFIAAYGGFMVFVYSLIAGRDFFANIRYALKDVPADQFWYFGAPPNSVIEQSINLQDGVVSTAVILLFFACVFLYRSVRHRLFDDYLLLMASGYGIGTYMSQLGYYSSGHTVPAKRIIFGILVFLVWKHRDRITAFCKRYQLFELPQKFSGITLFLFAVIGVYTVLFQSPTAAYFSNPIKQFQTVFSIGVPERYGSLVRGVETSQTVSDGAVLSVAWDRRYRDIFQAMSDDVFYIEPLTNKEWVNGVERASKKQILVPVVKEVDSQPLQVGQVVIFPHSGKRTVKGIVRYNEHFWRVKFGKAIDAEKDVYPSIALKKPLQKNETLLWSTYVGILEDQLNIFHPSYDYIIHALGPVHRPQYLKDFKKAQPLYVSTIRYNFFSYESWLRNEHWDFYTELLKNYSIVGGSDYTIVWKKNAEPRDISSELVTINIDQTNQNNLMNIAVEPAEEPRLITLDVTYTIHNPWEKVPYVGSLPRHTIHSSLEGEYGQRYVGTTVIPYKETMSFPVLIPAGEGSVTLSSHTLFALPGARLEIINAQYSVVNIENDQLNDFFDIDVLFGK